MEIIERGKLPHETDPSLWWVGQQLQCKVCSTKFRLEFGDKDRVQANIVQMGLRGEVACKCPLPKCGAPCYASADLKRPAEVPVVAEPVTG